MRSPLYIALRFTSSRKRSLILSLTGIIFGVAFFICTQAQTQGFEQYFIDTILGTSGGIMVTDRFQNRYTSIGKEETAADMVSVNNQQARKYYSGITEIQRMMRVIREFSNVIACAPVCLGNVSARNAFHSEAVRLQGIDLRSYVKATSLAEQITMGDLNEFRSKPQGLLMGYLLADKLEAKVGDTISLTGRTGDIKSFTLCGIFQSGINVIDENRAYIHQKPAQRLLGDPYAVSSIIVKLRDPSRAPQLAEHLEHLLNHRARSWQERERGNLQIFKTLRLSAAITVSLIILLAGFSIFNILTLIVMEKIREIAILRSMGYRRTDISNIFLFQGLIVAAFGSVLGCGLGALLTWAISQIPVRVRGIIYADHFVVFWSWHHYFQAVVIAFTAVLIASYFPARRAARLEPVTILRGSGQ